MSAITVCPRVFYVTTLQSSLAGFEAIPPIQQTLGDEVYAKFLKANAANAKTVTKAPMASAADTGKDTDKKL